jgi:hypothetical protein
MKALDQSIFASVVTVLVGVWVAISPIWISVTGRALTSVIITGAVITLAGLVQLFWKNVLPSWVSGIAAVWLFASAFGFSNLSTSAKWSMALSAVAVFVLAFWDGVEISNLNKHNTREYHMQ